MSKDDLLQHLQSAFPGQQIITENRPTMISDHWFVRRIEQPGAHPITLGSDYTELRALKNAVATSA